MRMFSIAILLSSLTACGPNGESAQEQVDLQIEHVLDDAIPGDGSIHVVNRGRFVIGLETVFCSYSPGFGVDGTMISDALQSMGQSTYLPRTSKGNGALRGSGHYFGPDLAPEKQSSECLSGDPVLIRGIKTLNRSGKPYRLTLVVRQGDALWQGIVDRAAGTLHPDAFGIADDTPGNNPDDFGSSAEKDSISRDMQRLGLEFTNNLKGISD